MRSPRCLRYGSSQALTSSSVVKRKRNQKKRGRPSRMEETAYLARLFMSLTHCSVNKNEATGLVANPGAIATRCETSFPAGAPQRCRGKSTGLTFSTVAPDGRLTDGLKVGAGARQVSVLLVLAQVEFRPSWAPPISMPILLPSTAPLPSVLRRIAKSTKASKAVRM